MSTHGSLSFFRFKQGLSPNGAGWRAGLAAVVIIGGLSSVESRAESEGSAKEKSGVPGPVDVYEDAKEATKKKIDPKKLVSEIPSGPVAWIAGYEITRDAFIELYRPKVDSYLLRPQPPMKRMIRRHRISVSDRMIEHIALELACRDEGVEYNLFDLEFREAAMLASPHWEDMLAKRGETFESQRGRTIAELREQALLEQRFELGVSEAEVKQFYEENQEMFSDPKPRVRASHILIEIGPHDRKLQEAADDATREKWEREAKAKIQKVYQLAKKPGADFGALAKEHSEGPSAYRGGDLSIFNEDRMIPDFSAATFALRQGQMSEPVKTSMGYHIIKVFKSYAPGVLPYEDVQVDLRGMLTGRRRAEAQRALKRQLKEDYESINWIEDYFVRRRPSKKGKKKKQK